MNTSKTRERIISWQDQLEMMEFIAAVSSDDPDYEIVRSRMSNAFAEKYRRRADDLFTYEPIPDRELQKFQDWLNEAE